MGEVVQLKKPEKKEEPTEPHLAGEARCLACGHEWAAVVPVGLREFDCPQCKTHKGTMKNTVVSGQTIFMCKCGSELYRINRNGPYCIECGVHPTGWF